MVKSLVLSACLLAAGASPLRAQSFELSGWGVQGGITEGYVDYAGT